MPDRDWLDGNYARVYWTLIEDRPDIWRDKALLGWWVTLLVRAEMAWPAVADLPRNLPAEVEACLSADPAVIEVEDDTYRFHGVGRLRDHRIGHGQKGGQARVRDASRTERGRFAAAGQTAGQTAGPSERPARTGIAGDSLDKPLDKAAGKNALDTSAPAPAGQRVQSSPDVRPSTSTAGLDSPAPAPAREGRAVPAAEASPVSITCDDYRAHQSDHVRIAGVGWKCLACEKVRAAEDVDKDRRLRDRVPWPPQPADEERPW